MAKQPVLTLRQVARYLTVHPNTIYRLAQRGQIPAFKVGSDWRFNRESIDAWRLAQEKLSAVQCSQTTPAAHRLRSEVLDLIEWYFAEAMQSSVTWNDLQLFFQDTDDNKSAMRAELNRMVGEGLLEAAGVGKQKRYRLTPTGLDQVRAADGKSEKNLGGHPSFIRTGTSFVELEPRE